MVISKKQIEALLMCDDQKRYQHFIKRLADFEMAWGLWNSEKWLMRWDEQQGKNCLLLWPHEEYALLQNKDWLKENAFKPSMLSLEETQRYIIPNAMGKNGAFWVFPVQGIGFIVSPDKFRKDLEEELKCYE